MKREERNKLVLQYLPLVKKITYATNTPMDFDDVFQFGCIGLIKAADLYRPESGVKFSTYAYSCIMSHIIRGYHNTFHPIRRPVYINEAFCKLRKVPEYNTMKEEGEYDLDKLSELTGYNKRVLKNVLELEDSNIFSLDGWGGDIPDSRKDLDYQLDCKHAIEKIEDKVQYFPRHYQESFYKVFYGSGLVKDHKDNIHNIRRKLNKIYNGVPECIK